MKKLHDIVISKKFSRNVFIICVFAWPLLVGQVLSWSINWEYYTLAFKKFNVTGNYTWVLFDNFKAYLQELVSGGSYLYTSLINSLKMYILNLIISMPLYIFFSYAIFKKFRGKRVAMAIIMLPMIISGFTMCLVFRKFVESALPSIMQEIFHVENFPNLLSDERYLFGTIIFYMIWSSFAMSLMIYPNAMKEIPDELFESAQIDGLNNMFKELWYIILPMIFPTLSTTLVLGYAGILTQTGPIMEFYMFDAPLQAYTMGYYYLSCVKTATTYEAYPLLAAGGLMMTALVAPTTMILRHLFNKYGPSTDM